MGPPTEAVIIYESAIPADALERALPNVVLMLAYRPDGTTGYGAGLIVSHDGLVITNLHVVSGATSLAAMLYDKNRVSYTPMDGGLTRYLFENERALVRARLVRGDPTNDLALVKVDADTSKIQLLELSNRPVRPGEPVLALGHPQETVWSFTAGVVSAIHHGAIQHDAAVNRGNSGGPLLSARGEVIGINTSRVLGDADGLAFARPIDLVQDLIQQVARGPRTLDLSAPDKAVLSCMRAEELASPDIAHCFDWEARWVLLQNSIDEQVRMGVLTPEEAAAARRRLDELGGKEGWIEDRRRYLVGFVRGERARNNPERPPPANDALHLEAGVSGATGDEKVADTWDPRLLERNGLKLDVSNPRAIQEVLRMGIRVEEVKYVRDDLAWVLVNGRNTDGTPYRFSECWVKKGDRWLQHSPPSPEEVKLLPPELAPPIDDYDSWKQVMVQGLIRPTSGAASTLRCREGTRC